ncbi:bacteriohemerythrin [Kistimonas asteriae]|uniref:bacteriohemerythrin n=1 Tax=Kistimonas asteriae TaxID=517724 RepID=UPI001BAA4BE3|nr:bacteriohemerythrin [Kistimonas asteriae]
MVKAKAWFCFFLFSSFFHPVFACGQVRGYTPLMSWTEEQYGTTVPKFDEEHKNLFRFVNQLHRSIVENQERSIVKHNLDALVSYVVEHFRSEEEMMQAKGFEGYEAHKRSHDKFVETCVNLQEQFAAGQDDITLETMQYIKNWLDSHIPNTDRQYGPFLMGI